MIQGIRWLTLCVAAGLAAAPAFGQVVPDKGPWTAEQDHQNMMDQLGIKALRHGPNPNDQSTFDEATANP